MPYRIKGTLKLPSGQPAAGVDIEFISRRNYSPLLMDLSSIIKTTSTGAYDITLEYGEYAVVVYWGCNQPSHIGKLFVFSDTAVGLDLQTLLQQADWQPATPEYIQQIQDWLAQAGASASQAVNSAAAAKASNDAARSEADRAKAEAGKASQVVIDSAVPFPDVWIPFNDSLRMFAGYGREVKVGDDVVARMVNFERSTTATYIDKSGVLRTAAINEPRFEKQGLLIEGQSTNLINDSETYKPTVHGGVTAVSTSKVMGFNFVKQVNDGSNGGIPTTMSGKFDIKKGDVLTYSAVFRLPDDGEAAGRFRCRIGHDGGFAFDLSFYNELSNDREVNAATNVITKTQPFADKSLVKVVRTFTAAADYTGAFVQLQSLQVEGVTNVGCHQLEVLPFASSYIPTNGTAVTRAADKCWIAASCNFPACAGVTIACTVSAAWVGATAPNVAPRVMSALSSAASNLESSIYQDGKFNSYGVSGGSNVPFSSGDTACTIVDKVISSQVGGVRVDGITPYPWGGLRGEIYIGTQEGTSARALFGHIRNFRIWHHALSDAQIKGLK